MAAPPLVIIEEVGKPRTDTPVQDNDGFDLQDALLAAGILFSESAALVIWWPAALILAALFSFAFAWLIQQASKKEKTIGSARS